MSNQKREMAMPIAIMLVVVVAITALFLLKTEKVIITHTRWWNAFTYVKYDEWECDSVIDAEGDYVRKCGWKTHMRCRSLNKGTAVDVVYPDPGCEMRGGDYKSRDVDYRIQYHEQENPEVITKSVSRGAWLVAEDGKTFDVVQNGFGQIVSIQER